MKFEKKFYRGDIQGIRAISALIIMVYHIWLAKVSGGVDVFFVISGFLIGTNMLRELEATGQVGILNFWARMSARILPSALFVILCTALLTLLFVPPPLWKFGVNELIASLLQVENWELYRTSTNYLNRDDPPSQFQQFWALSIQFQFYFLIPLLFVCVVRFNSSSSPMSLLLYVFLVIAFVSLAWSFYFSSRSPAQAYFSTLTRLWEFFFGVILAYAYGSIAANKLPPKLAGAFYTAALIVFVAFGYLVPGDVPFPGIVAVVPVACAMILIGSGASLSAENAVFAFLSSKRMQFLGALSFTVYLWHWPLLISAQHVFETTDLNVSAGVVVIFLSVVCAWLTHRLIETPLLTILRSIPSLRALSVCVGTVAVVTVIAIGLRQYMIIESKSIHDTISDLSMKEKLTSEMLEVRPDLRYSVVSNYDRPDAILQCLGGPICEFGDLESEFTVLMIGESHLAQWQTVLDYAGKTHGFKVMTALTNSEAMLILEELKPDVVFTIATFTSDLSIDANKTAPGEVKSEELIALLDHLKGRDIPVIGIRDNPRFVELQNACVWQRPGNQASCSLDRKSVFADVNPANVLQSQFSNLFLVDLSDLYCFDDICPAVIDGLFVYYDRHHFSKSFLRRIAERAAQQISRQAPGVLP